MSYFQNFPKIFYQFNVGNRSELKIITDLAFNTRVRDDILENIDIFNELFIKEGDTPEIISEKLYGTPLYHWVVMLANNMLSMEDFPIGGLELEEYTFKKYRLTPNDDKQTVLTSRKMLFGQPLTWDYKNDIRAEDEPFTRSVTNIEYELYLNESKKKIRVVSPQMIEQVVSQFNKLF
jgi:hypothetical protein